MSLPGNKNLAEQPQTAHSCNEHFVCPVHRKWLYLNPLIALQHLDYYFKQGQCHYSQKQLKQAVIHLGTAFEIAKVVLDISIKSRPRVILQMTTIAILLAECYGKSGEKEKATRTLKEAKAMLTASPALPLTPKIKIENLKACLEALDKGLEYYKCIKPLVLQNTQAVLH